MAKKLDVDLENPIEQAGAIAKHIVDSSQNELSEISKKSIDNELIDSIINIALNSKIDDSPLVIKQKIRNIIKLKVRNQE